MIYTVSAGISDVPLHWQCGGCGQEVVARDVTWVERARLHHVCPTHRDLKQAGSPGPGGYYERLG